MKISIIASRVLAGLSIVATFASVAVANTDSSSTGSTNSSAESVAESTSTSVTDSTTFKEKFQANGGNWNFNNQEANLILNFDITKIKQDEQDTKVSLNHIEITSNSLQVDSILGGSSNFNVENPLEDTYSFNINAKDVRLNNQTNVFHNSNITGNTTFNTSSSLHLGGGNLNINGDATFDKVAGFNVENAISLESGQFNVTGNLNMTNNTSVSFGSIDRSWNNNNQGIYVGKTATISGNTFNIQSSNLPLGTLNLITAGTIANANDFGTNGTMGDNKINSIYYTKDLTTMLTPTNQSLLNQHLILIHVIDAKTAHEKYISYNLELSEDKKTIFIKGEMTEDFKDIFNENQTFSSLQTFANELTATEESYITQASNTLTTLQSATNFIITDLESEKTRLESEKTTLENQKAELDKQLAEADDETKKNRITKSNQYFKHSNCQQSRNANSKHKQS